MNISKIYNLPFLKDIQDDLDKIPHKKQELFEQDYVLENQTWHCSGGFPKTLEIDEDKLEFLVFEADFVIVTATPIELKAVVRLLEPYVPEEPLLFRNYTRWGTYYLGKFGYYKTVVTQCRMGTRDERGAGFVTQKALEIWKPKAVIMVGIAFGKSSTEQRIGDVLVATEIIDYDVNHMGLGGIVDRESRPPSSRNLLDIFEQAHEWAFSRPDGSACQLISGPVLSGDKLVDNPEFKAELFRMYATLGEHQQAIQYYEQALPVVVEVGDRSYKAAILYKLAKLYYHLDDWNLALEGCEEAKAIAAHLDIPLVNDCEKIKYKIPSKFKKL